MFDDVLAILIPCRLLRAGSAAFILLGDVSDDWVAAQTGRDITPWLQTRVMFGLPIYTQPNPLLVKSVIAERGVEFRSLTCFGWIEDNFIAEPRTEVFGITPHGEEPLIFLRDCDLDRPPQCCLSNEPSQPHPLLLLAGVLWVNGSIPSDTHMLDPDEAALIGLQLTLPEDARTVPNLLRENMAAGADLRKALKAQRRHMDPNLAHFAEGWRIISRAVPLAHIGAQDPAPDAGFIIPALAPPQPKEKLPRKKR